jgi:cell division protein ZapA
MTTRSNLPAERSVQLDIQLLGRDYKVACKEDERADLLLAVQFLDKRMREIRDGGKISGADRIAVMAALNLATELLRERRTPTAAAGASRAASAGIDGSEARRKIIAMQAAIDQTMAGQEKLL